MPILVSFFFREYLEQILKAGAGAAALSRQAIAFSRQQVLAARVLKRNAIVGDMEPILLRLIGAYIDFGVVLDPYQALVKADRGQIEQVMVGGKRR